jgi:CheY-like chemotaxis protein
MAVPTLLASAARDSSLPSSSRGDLEHVKGVFLASLNHEIRTPLSGVLGMVDLLLETDLTEEQRDYVNAARLCAESLFEILNSALQYSALEAGNFTLDESEFSLRETLQAAVTPHQARAEEKGLKMLLLIDSGLPETVVGDAPRLREMLGHLVANAVKFTSSGSVELRASAERYPGRGDFLRVAVIDTGIGISPDKIESIFDSFQQGENGLTRTYSGLGLGLALARKLANLMGGDIYAASTPGAGSTFTLEIPLRRAEPNADYRAEGAVPDLVDGPRILAVDDNPVGLRVLRHLLERRGVRVDCVTSGAEALRAASLHQYKLVLMDLQMPEMDGLTAAVRMREVPGYGDVPILALTANFSDQVREQCRAHGMQAYLSKPIEANDLWLAVSRYLNREPA